MKTKFLTQLSLAIFLLLAAVACRKVDNQVYFDKATPPALTASSSTVALAPGKEADNAITLNWTNPNYYFTTGLSSHDVKYKLEMDTLGANFTSGVKYTTTITADLIKSYTVGELNSILGNTMLLTFGKAVTLEVRITATLASNQLPVMSNVIKFTATPFAPPPKVDPPSGGTLFIVGDATLGGWDNNVPVPSQQFTKISSTLFELTLPLNPGKSYKFLGIRGSWDQQWSTPVKNDPAYVNGGDFRKNGEDVMSPAAVGNYKITVNFQTGKFTVVKQ